MLLTLLEVFLKHLASLYSNFLAAKQDKYLPIHYKGWGPNYIKIFRMKPANFGYSQTFYRQETTNVSIFYPRTRSLNIILHSANTHL